MSSIKQRDSAPSSNFEAIGLGIFIAVSVVTLGTTWSATHLAAKIDGDPAPPANPFTVLFGIAGGDVQWTPTATKVAIGIGVVLLTLVALIGWMFIRMIHGRARVDRATQRMGRGRGVKPLSRRAVAATATRLGVQGAPGLEVGRSLSNGKPLMQDWESVSVDIWGPRTGKSSCRAIPAIMAAPGAVVATSNKRDLVDATRDPRSSKGDVWVFDPQGLTDEPVTWWWNPLSYVTDETKAQALADLFFNASRKPGARSDPFFDGTACSVLAAMLLAASVAGKPITDVYLWITAPNNDEPVRILERTDYPLIAAALRGAAAAPDKQRAGVYASAQQIVSFLTNTQATSWVTPPRSSAAPQFDPETFVRSTGTLYSLSKEGRGNAGPLVTALTVAVCEAAEEYAKTQPGGRLSVPLVVVLDEAANVCRWQDLPDLYSHYGSRGVNVLTFLQSWSQGVETWGPEGMRKLWSASTVKVYGGGVSEPEFLEEVSKLIGDYQHTQVSTSHQRNTGRSTSFQHRTDRILDVSDLAALDRGRILIFASGAVPVLARTLPWFEGPDKAAIAASVAAHDPGARA